LQPGSTIKVFTYSAALATRRFTMTTPIVDGPVRLDDGSQNGYSPHNYDHSFHGVCALARCLGNSYNIPAVKVEAAVGIPTITDLEIAAGLTSLSSPKNRPKPNQFAATLGGLTYGVSPLEMADGISTIANMGVHHDATPVLRITDAQGISQATLKDIKVENAIMVAKTDKDFAAASVEPFFFYDTSATEYVGYVYTDRPVYRPTHEVNFKGIVRARRGGEYSIDIPGPVTVEIADARQKKIYQQKIAPLKFRLIQRQATTGAAGLSRIIFNCRAHR